MAVIKDLNTKKRKIRSLRGFFLYALEIMKKGKKVSILTTNLHPFFWKKVENTIKQNKKSALIHFLFGTFELKGKGQTKEFKLFEKELEKL